MGRKLPNYVHVQCDDAFVERVRNQSTEKIWDTAEIQTQDLLNTSQTLLPLILVRLHCVHVCVASYGCLLACASSKGHA